MEKAYKAWSSELTNELNMLEADMSRFINFNKTDFVGRAATLGQAARPFKIVYAEVAASDTDARGGEPVLDQDRCIGVTTSGAYGHRVGKSLAFACVAPDFAAPGSRFEVLIQGERRAATVLPGAAFDPDNARMRA
jgi:dimethylglycine dehydrogenase